MQWRSPSPHQPLFALHFAQFDAAACGLADAAALVREAASGGQLGHAECAGAGTGAPFPAISIPIVSNFITGGPAERADASLNVKSAVSGLPASTVTSFVCVPNRSWTAVTLYVPGGTL